MSAEREARPGIRRCAGAATRWPRLVVALLVAVAGLLSTTEARAQLRVAESHWGFAGGVTPDAFQPLSVLLTWNGAAPWRGTLRLQRDGFLGRFGVPHVRELVMMPGDRRWVHFHPFYELERAEWSLTATNVRVEDGKLPVPSGQPPPAIVLLAVGGGTELGVPTMDASRWPSTVAATSGLRRVVLEQAPDWDAARRRSFLDWMQLGGKVHVLDSPATRDSYAGELSVLVGDAERVGFGHGQIRRYKTREALRAAVVPFGIRTANAEDARSETESARHEQTVRALREMVLPDHPWPLIALVALLFVLWIGPVQYGLRDQFRGGGGLLLGVGGAAILCSVCFYFLGKRGHDSVRGLVGVCYARHLDGARYDVHEWFDVATGGAVRVDLGPVEGGGAIDTPGAEEALEGFVEAGTGRMVVDLPIFAHQGGYRRSVRTRDEAVPIRVVRGWVSPREGPIVAVPEQLADAHRWYLASPGLLRRMTRDSEGPESGEVLLGTDLSHRVEARSIGVRGFSTLEDALLRELMAQHDEWLDGNRGDTFELFAISRSEFPLADDADVGGPERWVTVLHHTLPQTGETP